MAGWSTGRGRETGGLLSVWVCLCVEWGAEEGRGLVIRTRGWGAGWEGVKKKKEENYKENRQGVPGSENWHAAVVCLSPSNKSSPSLTPLLPHLPLRSLIQQICSECMAALLTKRILRWGLRMWASAEHATQLPIDQRGHSLRTPRSGGQRP